MIGKGVIMNKLAEDKRLKEEIEKMRQELYTFIDENLSDERIVSFSQELDLLINKYNKWEKYGGWNSNTSTIFSQIMIINSGIFISILRLFNY